MRYKYITLLATLIAALDQLSKWLVNKYIGLYDEIVVTSFFSLVNIRNRGAAFGFLNSPDINWQFWLFAAITLIAVGVIFFMAYTAHKKEYLLFTGLGFVLGGAIGNFVDRIRMRSVVDFLDFHWNSLHWPAFNVADIAICLGAFLIAYISFNSSSKV